MPNITRWNLIWKIDLVFRKDKIGLISFFKDSRLVLSWQCWSSLLSEFVFTKNEIKAYLACRKDKIDSIFFRGRFLFFASRSPLSLTLSLWIENLTFIFIFNWDPNMLQFDPSYVYVEKKFSLHQIISIGSTNITDTWEPLEEGLLP